METIILNHSILIFNRNKEINYLPINEITYFEIFQKVVTVHCAKKKIKFRCTMTVLEELFKDEGFLRIHREYLINSRYVRKRGRSYVELKDSVVLPIGRYYASSVKLFFKEKIERKRPLS